MFPQIRRKFWNCPTLLFSAKFSFFMPYFSWLFLALCQTLKNSHLDKAPLLVYPRVKCSHRRKIFQIGYVAKFNKEYFFFMFFSNACILKRKRSQTKISKNSRGLAVSVYNCKCAAFHRAKSNGACLSRCDG